MVIWRSVLYASTTEKVLGGRVGRTLLSAREILERLVLSPIIGKSCLSRSKSIAINRSAVTSALKSQLKLCLRPLGHMQPLRHSDYGDPHVFERLQYHIGLHR